jgi:hypothetical protein
MGLWAEDGTFCIKSACYNGKKEIEEVMEGFAFLASISCDTKNFHKCFYLPNINKAACRFACVQNLKGSPSCVTDAFVHGIRTYEWNNAEELICLDEFFSQDDLNIALAACMPDKETDEAKPSKEM